MESSEVSSATARAYTGWLGRIDGPGRRPRTAAEDAPDRLGGPHERAVLPDRPLAVVAAGGLEPAADPDLAVDGRERGLVEMDAAEQRPGRDLVGRRPAEVEGQEDEEGDP